MMRTFLSIWIVLLVITQLTLGLVNHGATYVFKSVADDLILTANRHLFRTQGLRAGPVSLQTFDIGNPSQLFDVIFVKDKLYWLTPHHHSLNALTISPISEFPQKNFVSFIPVTGENVKDQFLIRSSVVNKCLQSQGTKLPVIYSNCDFSNKNQRFTAEFLYELDKDTSEFLSESSKSSAFIDSFYF